MDDRESNVEKVAGLALTAGRLYIGFWKWLLRILIVGFGLIALGSGPINLAWLDGL